MSKDRQKIYKIEIILTVLILICTFSTLTKNKYFTAGFLLISALVVCNFLKKKRTLKVNKKKIRIVMLIFGILYVTLYYMLGLYTGFYNQTNMFGIKTIIKYIIPITIIIISTEVIRDRLLIDKSTRSKALITIIGTLADISIYLDVYGFSNLNSFLGLVGFVSFAALANNLLFTYISDRYGKESIIIYRLITILYIYIIPVAPDVYIYFRAFVRMIYPLIIFSYLDKYYDLDKYKERPKELREQAITLLLGSSIIIILIALISCKFFAGVLVIGSESMTGSIDKGDVVFFLKKDDIKTGDVIVFKKEDIKVVHRVITVKNVNKEFRYYTKGDANKMQDEKYVTKGDLIGKVTFKIKYIGKPTLWLHDIFDKEG
ncbi:MAG: signal peptidase I [Bacilli bacterium]|nr:signal peptidase I [Bacilli bacterium]